jgi:hypothetical protein
MGAVPELHLIKDEPRGFIDYAYVKHGMAIEPCKPEQCKEIEAIHAEAVFLLGDTVVFRFPQAKN